MTTHTHTHTQTNSERATAQQEYEYSNPDSLDAQLFPSVVLAVAYAVTMDEASSLLGYLKVDPRCAHSAKTLRIDSESAGQTTWVAG